MKNKKTKSLKPEVVSGNLIINKKKSILLVKSKKFGRNFYVLPGGHVKFGETLAEAAKREGEEETGLKLKVLQCVNVGTLINLPWFYRSAQFVFFYFVCKALTSKLKLNCRELHNKYVWVNPVKALKMNVPTVMKKSIKNYIKGIKFDLNVEKYG